MPVYQLSDAFVFPDPALTEPDGLLAVGGDLHPERLIQAYANGIFPWYAEDNPILWWSPDPRMVLIPKEFKRYKSLKQVVRNGGFNVSFDAAFPEVIEACRSTKRQGQEGTWITTEMKEAYIRLFELGVAHSVEVKKEGKLVGGLYGLMLGKVFFGESMFHRQSNASKVALWHLVDRLEDMGVELIDAQQDTSHLQRMGGRLMERKTFLTLLAQLMKA
jgi:leucyl/phenylalanyl-tRNA--protein transferase